MTGRTTTDDGAEARRGPGRPRSARAHRATLEAALELLAAEGFRGLTVEGVAARAGVAKTTIYRWWPSKLALIREAIVALAQRDPVPDSGSAREDAVSILRGRIEQLSDPRLARIAGELIVEALRNPELDQARPSLVAARRAALQQVLERGVARGELPEDLDYELTMDLLVGPIVLRALATDGGLDPELAERIVDRVFDGVRGAAPSTAPSETDRPARPIRSAAPERPAD